MTVRVIEGDCRKALRELPAQSVQCVVTSPPYFGLRDYGTGTWDGGDPECDHTDKQSFGKGRGSGVWYDGGKPEHVNGFRPLLGPRCACGAIRTDSQIGLEATPAEYIAEMVAVFREVRRVLRDDGTCWLNLGDSYASSWPCNRRNQIGQGSLPDGTRANRPPRMGDGLKEKDLMMIPARVAIALVDDGWYLRSDIIWHKPNPMPESVTDRPTSSHEHIFLLTKSGDSEFWTHRDGLPGKRSMPPPDYRWIHARTKKERTTEPDGWATDAAIRKMWRRLNLWSGRDYFYDAEAVREPSEQPDRVRADKIGGSSHEERQQHSEGGMFTGATTRNLRNVWTVTTTPYKEAHFATFPPEIAERCIKAGTSEQGACPTCEAPWARIMGASVETGGRGAGNGFARPERISVGGRGDETPWVPKTKATTGWSPTCDCPDAPPIPCTVLDPFGGAGTVGMVADRLQRDAVLIELNPDYAAMSRDRMTGDAPLFAQVL